jgi:hypothetical protein
MELTSAVTFKSIECCTCGLTFYVPSAWYKKKQDDHSGFPCPNGCRLIFNGESESDRLKKQLAQAERELANKTSEKIQLEGQLEKTQKQLRRVHRGTCPCCKRTFQNLRRHMESKHPENLKK